MSRATHAERVERAVGFVRALLQHLPADELTDIDVDDPTGLALGFDKQRRPRQLNAPGRSYTVVRGCAFRVDRADDGRQHVTAFRNRTAVGEYVEGDEP